MKHISEVAGAKPDSGAGAPPAVPSTSSGQAAGASRPRFAEVTIRHRARLPHWEKDGGTYFITFRLVDSLPKSVLDRVKCEQQAIVTTANQLHRALRADERKRIQQLSTPAIEQFLDSGAGACHLRKPAIAEELADTLRHFDQRCYRLFAWCIMPNRVHVVVKLFLGEDLAAVVHSWKSLSAKQANQILGGHGAFWQREYYDHLIRGEEEFEPAVRYVAENPAKANLRHWKWIWMRGRDARTTAAEHGGATKTA